MQEFEGIIFVITILVVLSAVSRRIRLPYPVMMVTAGLAVGFIPTLPDLSLNPDAIFSVFLPPLLFESALKTSWNEFRAAIKPITALAVSLVFITTISVAIAAKWLIPGFSWPLAFVLGAIVSPPDAVAATGITRGLGLGKQVTTILEGESLINDAAALITYRYAVIAIATGTFIFWQAGLDFIILFAGGITAGIISGMLFAAIHKRIKNNAIVNTSLNLLIPFISYLAAERLQVSGVLAVVAAGLVIAHQAPEIFNYDTRLRTRAVWDTIIFLLNGFIFILMGMQLPAILKSLNGYTVLQLVGYGIAISSVTIIIRIIWVFAGVSAQKLLTKWSSGSEENTGPDLWKNVLIIAWTGTRGVVSLATALALPLVLYNGKLLAERPLIIFLAFMVIFATFIIQGMSLPLLIKLLKIRKDSNVSREEKELQLVMTERIIAFITNDLQLVISDKIREDIITQYESFAKKLEYDIAHPATSNLSSADLLREPVNQLLSAQIEIVMFRRQLLLQFHKEAIFSDDVIRKYERDMDMEEMNRNK